MEDIQSWWELPSIAHFCSLFRAAFDLLDFDIEELEEAILTDGFDRSGSPLLIELLVRLLQGCLPGRNITPSNVDSYLRKLFRQKCQEDPTRENLFVQGEFRSMELRKKVEVLHALCDFRLEADDVLDLLKNLETESLRVEPLGYDDSGATYWYFYGTRLYREDNSIFHPLRRRPREKEKDKEEKRKKKRKKKSHREIRDSGLDSEEEDEEEAPPCWQVQCYTEEDWRNLSNKFEGSESRLERSLLQTLKDDFLPEIPRLFEEKEKIQQKRMMEFAPRRTSGRVQKMKEKKEEEEKRMAEELEEQEKQRIKEDEKLEEEVTNSLALSPEKEEEEEDIEEEEEKYSRINEVFEEEPEIVPEEKEKKKEEKKSNEKISKEKGRKRRRKEELLYDKKIERWQDREEEVLHERNKVSQESNLFNDDVVRRSHKEKKPHHRKHHKRSHHSLKNNHSLVESLPQDNQVASDTSNKENSCLIDALSDEIENAEDDMKKPQVYSGRKTNNSLSSLAFSLSPATVVPEPQTQMVTSQSNKKRVKRSHMLLQTEDDLRTGMYKMLEHLRDHEDAWPFLDPVDETFAPNYYAVIRRPMYITKMESRLDSGFYSCLSMFEADFKLMMDNCKLYNGPESEYTHMAYTLEKVFAKLKSKYLETEFSSDEEIYIDMSFQQAVKRKNRKRKSTEEKENNKEDEGGEEEKKKKRGRQKKKVGRKPKNKTPEVVVVEKKRGRGRAKKEEKEKRGRGRAKKEEKEKERGRSKEKHKSKKESLSLPEEGDFKDNEIENENEVKGEDEKRVEEEEDEEDDDEDDFDGPLLLVREDPYPEDEEGDEEEKLSTRLSPPVSEDEGEEQFNLEAPFSPSHKKSFKGSYGSPSPTRWKKEPDKILPCKGTYADDDNELENTPEEEDKTKKKRKGKERRESKGEKKKKKKEESVVREEKRESLSPAVAPSDSDSDHDGGILLYYNNMEEEGEEETEKVEKKDLSERHCELFGEIDDIEDEVKEEEGPVKEDKDPDKKRHHCNHSTKHDKKRKGSSTKDRRKHHKHGTEKHHHHHHHRSKSKHHHQSKHHHHKRKTKHVAGKESPGKKVLKVEEVYEYSEEDPTSKEQDVFLVPPPVTPVKEEPVENVQEESRSPNLAKTESIKKKKNRRKGKHDKRKHVKRKENKEKIKENKQGKEKSTKKISKRKSIKKIIKKKRKRIPIKKLAAIDALSAATEQTLKDITSLLDDPAVPRFAGESPEASPSSQSNRVTSEEYESFALTIEAEYRRKLKMDSSEQKVTHKKKKRKAEEENEEEPMQKKKKVKKENKDNKEKENEKKVDKEKGSLDSLDNTKELFKDIKDGRIKPGAIIKSKDIAKKEGMVKKETKTSTEGKPKAKQNPFGKINKQENSKLTTLIAKAKESRIGLVPNSEVGASPKLSLGSIILFGDIGSGKHSSREPNSPAVPPDEEDKTSEKYLSDKQEKWDSPCWGDRPCDSKDEASNPPSQITEEEEEEEKPEEIEIVSPPSEEIPPPPTPRGPGGQEFKQERATPNLSAWFRAFGGPKLTAAPRKKMDGEEYDEDEVEDEDKLEEPDTDIQEDDRNPKEEVEEEEREFKKNEEDNDKEEIKVNSPGGSIHENPIPSPRLSNNNSPEPPVSPQPPLSPEKPPETPWFDKIGEKEDEPIWRKNKTEEEDDPYKFEEEELDRAREEAKKLEVERQRKASVSSSGLSDPSPLNIDSDRSPAAFSSEGERSPLTRSPATTKSPVTPGFGSTAKQFSPVTEKSPNVPVFSPRFDTGLGKGYAGYEDKSKYQANGTLKVGFYQDMTDKTAIGGDKTETVKCLDQKIKESPIYSPTVPYVSPLYSNKDSSMCKQKSPGRYGSYYSSIDSSTLDKPKTPGYYSTSAPSTPSDRPSPVPGSIQSSAPSEDKPKAQYSYYNYDTTKSLTDQYKNTGSNASKSFFLGDVPSKSVDRSPIASTGDLTAITLKSPISLPMSTKAPPTNLVEKKDPQPPKKRGHQQSQIQQNISSDSVIPSWGDKRTEVDRLTTATPLRSPFSPHPLPANLANLSHIVSRLPEPESEPSDKESLRLGHDHNHSQTLLTAKAVQSTHLFDPPQEGLPQASPSIVPDLHHQSSRAIDPVHPPTSDLSHHQSSPLLSGKVPVPPAAHQKTSSDGDRPGSRNMPPPPTGEKPHGYLHQKTMWSSSLPSSIPSSLSSLVSNATMASIALAGQKGLGSFPSEHFAQFGMDRATLASLASRSPQTGGQLFTHDLIPRNSSSQGQVNPPSMPSPSGLSLQPHLNGTSGSGNASSSHNRSSGGSSGGSSTGSASSGSSSIGASTASSNNFDLGLARSYASIMSASQTSPLFVRSDTSLTPVSLTRSLSGSPSPFLPQSPGLGTALGIPGSSRTPTPAHQQSLSQSNFPTLSRDPRDPRDPISQSHPSLQIPSLNSITCSQTQSLGHLNSASLASYTSRDSLALMSQGGRGSLVGVDPTHQQLYQQYLQRHQLQEELLLRSAGAHSQLAHQSMMIQQGLMSAAAASYPSGYPHTLGLRSGTYQGMNRPWI